MPDTVTLLQAASPVAATTLLSVVVPVRNEGPNILALIAEIGAALHDVAHEIVYVDDGSSDDTAERLAEAAAGGARLVRLRHRSCCGQSAAVLSGVRAASGSWIATLDGDGQNDPADILRLLACARAHGWRAGGLHGGDPQAADPQAADPQPADPQPAGPLLIAGHRTRRRDSLAKRAASRVANAVRAALLRDHTPDTGCGLKLFEREAFLALPHFDHMHRYLPALFIRAGGRAVSVPVGHRPRTRGHSKYGTLDRLWVGLFDLVGVFWLQRRWHCPVVERLPPAAGTDPADRA